MNLNLVMGRVAGSIEGKAGMLATGALVMILVVATVVFLHFEHIAFEDVMREKAEEPMAILEALHTQAMLHRDNPGDDNGVIKAMNATLEQLSIPGSTFSLWLVMGPKVLAYQELQSHQELEPPRDDLDRRAIEEGVAISQVVGSSVYRVTRPIILGSGPASAEACIACHGGLMGIRPGEVIGAYSIAVSVAEDAEQLSATTRAAVTFLAMTALLAVAGNSPILRGVAARSFAGLGRFATSLARGRMAGAVRWPGPRDGSGDNSRPVPDIQQADPGTRDNLTLESRHQAELGQALRRGCMAEMTTTLAHELAQPLTMIASYSGALSKRLELTDCSRPELIAILGRIADIAHWAGDLTHAIACQVRGDGLTRKSVVLNDLVKDVEPLLRAVAKEGGAQLLIRASAPPVTLKVSKAEVESVILNAVRNGIEAMNAGDSADKMATVRTAVRGGIAVITVADRGPGISSDVLRRVFEPFFTTKAGGLGMGLSISRRIIESHGGRLTLRTRLGRGTVVHILLPVQGVHDH